jgi:hypothetical protein
LEQNSPATVTVYSAMGEPVATLFDGLAKAGQLYQFKLKTADLATGVYFYRISTNGGSKTNRLLLTH